MADGAFGEVCLALLGVARGKGRSAERHQGRHGDGQTQPAPHCHSSLEASNGYGSILSIAATFTKGVPNPKDYRSGMPPMDGAQFDPAQVLALADYIWSLNHEKGE